MEKNLKENLAIYLSLNHFGVHQKRIEHCKSTILQFLKKILYEKNFLNRIQFLENKIHNDLSWISNHILAIILE